MDEKKILNHIVGPKGWTMGVSHDTVKTLVTIGIIVYDRSTSTEHWQTDFYRKAP